MFDVQRVSHEAELRGFHELMFFLENHKVEYAQFILTGEEEEGKQSRLLTLVA
jgi:hypothetical protein